MAFRLVADGQGESGQVAIQREASLRARWLGRQLREMREQKGLTLKDVASYAQRDASSLSRMEAGIHPARTPEVLAYLAVCEIHDDRRREALVQLAIETRETGWWDEFPDFLGSLIDRIWLESRAIEIRSFDAIVIPGSLQTRQYAEAVIQAAGFDTPKEHMDLQLEARMQRKERMEANEALHIDVVMDESVLHRLVGGRETMIEQLDHLLERADHPKMTIRVLPWSAGAPAAADGAFDLIRLEHPYPSGVAYVPSAADARFVEGEWDVERMEAQFRRLVSAALEPEQSKLLISEVRRKLVK